MCTFIYWHRFTVVHSGHVSWLAQLCCFLEAYCMPLSFHVPMLFTLQMHFLVSHLTVGCHRWTSLPFSCCRLQCVLAISSLWWALIKASVSFTSIISNTQKAEMQCSAWPLAACWSRATGILPIDKLHGLSMELLSSKMLNTNRIAGDCNTSTAEGMIPPMTGVLNTTPAEPDLSILSVKYSYTV